MEEIVAIDHEIQNILKEISMLQLKLSRLYKRKAILTGQECYLERIPSDLILNFCGFLDPRDILRFGAVRTSN